MAINYEILYKLIEKAFPEAKIELKDMVGDSNHYELTITSNKFKNLSLIEQHKLVYRAIDKIIGRELHALKINTINEDE
jgi:stress-induced morphogen